MEIFMPSSNNFNTSKNNARHSSAALAFNPFLQPTQQQNAQPNPYAYPVYHAYSPYPVYSNPTAMHPLSNASASTSPYYSPPVPTAPVRPLMPRQPMQPYIPHTEYLKSKAYPKNMTPAQKRVIDNENDVIKIKNQSIKAENDETDQKNNVIYQENLALYKRQKQQFKQDIKNKQDNLTDRVQRAQKQAETDAYVKQIQEQTQVEIQNNTNRLMQQTQQDIAQLGMQYARMPGLIGRRHHY
jgi:hypothetical protein